MCRQRVASYFQRGRQRQIPNPRLAWSRPMLACWLTGWSACCGAKGRPWAARPALRPEVDAPIKCRRLVEEAGLLQVTAARCTAGLGGCLAVPAGGGGLGRTGTVARVRGLVPPQSPELVSQPRPHLRSSESRPGGRPRHPGRSRRASSSSLQAVEYADSEMSAVEAQEGAQGPGRARYPCKSPYRE